MAPAPPEAPARARAGFSARYAAWSLDAACLLPVAALLGASHMGAALARARAALDVLAHAIAGLFEGAALRPPIELVSGLLGDPRFIDATGQLQAAVLILLGTPVLLYAVLALPWAIGFETSPWQATPGKRALGLVVVDRAGHRLRPTRALGRHVAAGLSWLSLNLGHAMAMLPPEHLALHDRVSATQVLQSVPGMPRWAKAWLALQAVAACAATAWLFLATQAAMQAAMQQALDGL